MNAVEIIERVRAHHAEVVIEDDELIVRGCGEPLPAELQLALKQHKPAILVALGAPREVAVLDVLEQIRPFLPSALQTIPDSSLLALVNWSLLHAWNSAASQLDWSKEAPRCRKCGIAMSVVRVSDVCGKCAL
jgi:hypothetical protein